MLYALFMPEAKNPANVNKSTTTSNNTSSNFSEGQTATSGGYNFVYQNGKWIAK